MDPRASVQDVFQCHLCETPGHPMYCDICHIHLCKPCVGEHISDPSTEHKVVSFENRGSTTYYPKCPKHSTKQCELRCEQCDIPICSQCILSGEHEQHEKVDILESIEIPDAESSPPDRPLIDEPRLIANINTEQIELCGVSCLSDDKIWVCGGGENIMRLYDLRGNLAKSIQTESGNKPSEMHVTVTTSGDLVYTYFSNRTVNILKNTQIQTVIKLRGWKPRDICSTSAGDLLVVMDSDDIRQAKVGRYSGSTAVQSIQFNDKGQPLYSSGLCMSLSKEMSMNTNTKIHQRKQEPRCLRVRLQSPCSSGSQSARKTPVYLHWLSRYYQRAISAMRHHYRQPESDPDSRFFQPMHSHPGSGRTGPPLH